MEIYLEGILVAMRGAAKTLGVSFFALLVGAALGLGFALMKKSHNRPVRILSKIYIEVVRGTPMIVQALKPLRIRATFPAPMFWAP